MTNFRTCILLLGILKFSNSYYVPDIQPNFQNSSRDRRQIANGSCQIPNNPSNGKYAIRGDDANTYREGDYVPELIVILYLKCDGTYRPSPPEIFGSYCVNGVWEPSPGVCSRTCKSIRTTKTTEVQCFFNDLTLKSCDNPVEGTVAQFTCEAFYEESSLENNPSRFCEDGEWNGMPQCYPICGQKHPIGRINVINGTNAKLGDYPWHVGVYNAQKDYRCGGTIITQRIILSAAHCFTSPATGELYPKENYLIAVGKYYREYSDSRDEHYQYSTIDSIHIPSRYKGSKLQYQFDIAVVVLAKELILTEAVQPVCVDWGNRFENQQLTPNNYGTVIGWGYTVEGLHLADELKELSIPFIPFDQCYDSVPRAFQTFLRQDKICGGYLNSSTSICEGDSGGGLVFRKRSTGRYFIRGIVSTSPATIERQCDSNQYGIYTLVSEHLDFINSIRNKPRPIPNTSTVLSLSRNSKYSAISSIPPLIAPSVTAASSPNTSTVRPLSVFPSVTAPSTPPSNLPCPIPNFTDYGIRTVQSLSKPSNRTLHQGRDLSLLADLFDVLTTRCSNEQTTNLTSSVCIDGSWRPKLTNCYYSPKLNLLPSKQVCGISQPAVYNVIAEAALNEFPWLVTLHSSSLKNLSTCEGVLINNRYVLTAASCLDHYDIDMARLGEYNFVTKPDCLNIGSRNICAPSPIDVPITDLITGHRNIGLGRLERVVDFTDYIKPICLPTSENLINKHFENAFMTVASWTSTPLLRDGSTFKTISRVAVKETTQCATSNNGMINSWYICTEGLGVASLCHGVDGSALMKFEQDENRSNWYAFGILTTGSRCGMKHTRVTSYMPWILSKIRP